MDWRAVRERYRPEAVRARNNAEFHAVMKRMLKELPVSHLEISMPREAGQAGTGVRTALIEGKNVIVEVPPASDAQRQGIRVGDILLQPDLESGPLGSTATLRVKGCDGRIRVVKARRESHSQTERPSIRWRTFSVGAGRRIGYIRAVRFDDDVAPLVDSAMAELGNTSGLIIDIRENSGGNMSFVRLSSYFAEGEHLVAALLTRYYLETQGSTPQRSTPANLPKAKKTYTDEAVFDAMRSNAEPSGSTAKIRREPLSRKVAVLINEETASRRGICLAHEAQNTVDPDRQQDRRSLARRRIFHASRWLAADRANALRLGPGRQAGNRRTGFTSHRDKMVA